MRRLLPLLAAALWVAAPISTHGETGPATGDAWSRKPVAMHGLDGLEHRLTEWKGKVVMLNFWAAWCAPCQAEIGDFVALQTQYRSQGLQIVGLGLDEEGKLRNVQRTLEINYPVLVADPARNAGLMREWGNRTGTIPYTVVIDRAGRIRYTHRGPLHRDAFDENILPLLDEGRNAEANPTAPSGS